MTSERIAILESMSWWVWDAYEAAWESSFADLKEYVEKYHDIRQLTDPTLGSWVYTQRKAYQA